ncbi:hypothetical protein ACLB2K_036632 [Fragaria x ananassa]
MYVTRPLSMYRRSPESLSAPTPEGPNSGYLVLHDAESDETTCFGCCDETQVKDLPFPQNKDLSVGYSSDSDEVVFIPVLDKPLSANAYHAWKVCTNSKKENMVDGWFGKTVIDVIPEPLDPSDIYQQIEMIPRRQRGSFTAKSVASDGVPPYFLRRKGWPVTMARPRYYQLGEAPGLNSSKRSDLPGFDFPLSKDCSEAVVVGKWHCPFLFIKEGGLKLKHQVKQCMFYEMRLEQRWEKIFDKYNEGKSNIGCSMLMLCLWMHLSKERQFLLQEMKFLLIITMQEERVGWVSGDERQVRVERVEEFGGTGEWKKFACYVLVERFVLKRLHDMSALLAYDFKHAHQIRSKWK